MTPTFTEYPLYIKIGKQYYGSRVFESDYDPINNSNTLLIHISESANDYKIIGTYKLVVESANSSSVYDPSQRFIIKTHQPVSLYKRVYDKQVDALVWKYIEKDNNDDPIYVFRAEAIREDFTF